MQPPRRRFLAGLLLVLILLDTLLFLWGIKVHNFNAQVLAVILSCGIPEAIHQIKHLNEP